MNATKTNLVTIDFPQELKDYNAPNGYYVAINKQYKATVRNLQEFKYYINNNFEQLDMEVFGNITNEDDNATPLFKSNLYKIIAEVKGFATFCNNGNKHQFIQCTEGVETISILTKGGKKITVCVMEDYGKCVDIKFHNEEEDRFSLIGFDAGQTPVPSTKLTLATILLY